MISSALIFSVLFLGTSLIGAWLPLAVPGSENHLKLFVSLGAGVLLGMAFLHLVPEAHELCGDGFGLWFLGGFVLLLVLERFVMVHACEERGCDYHTVGVAAFLGLATHSVIEGMALGSSLFISGLAPLVLVAILLHKAPAAFSLASILKLAGKTNGQVWLYVLGMGLSGPLGIALALGVVQRYDISRASGELLAISSGTFVYIGACDLLPELHKNDGQKMWRLGFFMVGLALSYAAGALLHH